MSVIGLDFCIRFGIQTIAVLFLLKYTFFRYSNDREALFSSTLFGHGEQSDVISAHIDEVIVDNGTKIANKQIVSEKMPGVKVADLKATGLSVQAVSRVTAQWDNEYKQWSQRSLDKRKYVYIWADGIYSKVKQDGKLCLLVVMGVDTLGRKELLAVAEGERESEQSWMRVLKQLHDQGKNYRNRQTTLMMVFKLAQSAEKNWQRFRDFKSLTDVTKGVNFKDGSRVDRGVAS